MITDVLFDLDGTLIDSSECIYKVYTQLFDEFGLTLPPEKEMRKFIGPPIETTIANYIEGDITEACNRFRAIYKTIDLMKTNKLYDGVASEIKKVKNSGKRVYVATSKGEVTALSILENFGIKDLFDGIYGSRFDLGRTTKTQVIEAIVGDNGLDKENCILIGDTVFDVEGAEKSGIKVAIVKYGFGAPEDFIGKKIEFFVDEVKDLAAEITRLS